MIVKLFILRSRIKTILITIIILLCLTSCEIKGRSDMQILLSDRNQTIYELITNIYTIDQLKHIEQSNYNYDDLCLNYPVQCIRKEGDIYRVIYRAKDRLLILYYNQYGELLLHKQVTLNIVKKEFDQINQQYDVYDVKAIDETGEYDFLYVGDTEIPKVSVHYTKDGYLLHIEYDERWRVIKVSWELI